MTKVYCYSRCSTCKKALAWLDAHGYLNDSDYASAVSRHYARKGYGSGRIRAEGETDVRKERVCIP